MLSLLRCVRVFMFLAFLSVAAAPPSAQTRKLVYGLVPNSPPTTYVDASGKPTGFFIELYSRILDDLGIEYEYRVGTFAELYPLMVAGDVDFFTTLVKTNERETQFIFAETAVSAGWGQLFVALGTELQSVLDLQHRTIGIVTDDRNGANFRTYIDSLAIPCTIVEYADFERLVKAVSSGEVYGGVQSNWFVAAEKRVQPTTVVFAPFRSYPVMSQNSPFSAELQKIVGHYSELLADPDSYYYELQAEWLGHERTETTIIPAWLIAALATLLVAAGVSVFVIRLLTDKLRVANRDLERKVIERTDLLVRSEKLAALGTLVAGIAHEFNTPLHVIMASLDTLRTSCVHDGMSSSELADLEYLIARRGQNVLDTRADPRARLRAIHARLLTLAPEDTNRLAPVFSELGVLEPDAEAVRILKSASPEMLAEALSVAVRLDTFDAASLALDRMGSIIRALRIYAHRDQKGEAVVVSLAVQIDSVLTLFSDRFNDEGIRVVADYDSLPEYRCFADQLQQVWMNIITNAIEAMGESGVLSIVGRRDGTGLCISVTDTGPGIRPEHRESIFEPFFTTKPEGAGTGLGLSTASEIVKTHRGTLEFDSSAAGATFTIRLPSAGIIEPGQIVDFKELVDA